MRYVLIVVFVALCSVARATPVPVVTTEDATDVRDTGATMNGTVNPQGVTTSIHFEWGPTTAYGKTSPSATAYDGFFALPASWLAAGLQPGTTYHFRAVAIRGTEEFDGADRTFTTATAPPPSPPADPAPQTGPAGAVTPTSATLNGVVGNTNGQTVSYQFEWGPTTAYGNAAPAAPHVVPGGMLNEALTGLEPATTYHFRLVAFRGADRFEGADQPFTTLPASAATPVPTSTYTITPQASPTPTPGGMATGVAPAAGSPTASPGPDATAAPGPAATAAPSPGTGPARLRGASKGVSLICADTCTVHVTGATGRRLRVSVRQHGRVVATAGAARARAGGLALRGRPAPGPVTVRARIGAGPHARTVSATFAVT